MTAEAARHLPASGVGSLIAYWRFYRAVAAAQLAEWLAGWNGRPALLLDISGPHLTCAPQAAAAGHAVVRAIPADLPREPPPPYGVAHGGFTGANVKGRPVCAPVATVRADHAALPFFDDSSVDGIIADDRTLSRHLFAEEAIAELARVLRPGGRVLACFDSLVLGMAILAEQHHWAELTDLPSAEVVLVPWPDGTITRCFGVEHLRELFGEAGFDILWIRPRTVLSPTAVEHVLDRDTAALRHLVGAELAAHPDESVGIHLIVHARKAARRRRRGESRL